MGLLIYRICTLSYLNFWGDLFHNRQMPEKSFPRVVTAPTFSISAVKRVECTSFMQEPSVLAPTIVREPGTFCLHMELLLHTKDCGATISTHGSSLSLAPSIFLQDDDDDGDELPASPASPSPGQSQLVSLSGEFTNHYFSHSFPSLPGLDLYDKLIQ